MRTIINGMWWAALLLFILGVWPAALLLVVIAACATAIMKEKESEAEKSTPELEFYRTVTDLDNNLRWDEEKRKMQKEQDLLRKSNEILIHLIQDEHREEDR